MSRKATQAQTRAVADQLKADPTVKQFRFSGGTDNYSESKRLFTGSPSPVVQSVSKTPSDFHVTLSKPVDWTTVKHGYGEMPGVERITPSDGAA